MKSAKNIEKLIRKINVTPGTRMDQEIFDDIFPVQEKTKKKFPADRQPNIWRTIMKSRITKFAVAAILIIAVLIGINQFSGSIDGVSVAWADVAEKVEDIQTFVCQRKDLQRTSDKDQTVETKSVIFSSAEYGSRIDSYKDENIQSSTYTLPAEKAIITVIPSAQKHFRRPLTEEMLKEMEQKGPREIVRRFFSLEYKELGSKIINSVVVEGIEVNDPKVLSANFPVERVTARLWVNVETNLPVLLETEVVGQEETFQLKTIVDEFQWNVALDAEVFKPDIGIDESSLTDELLYGPRVHIFADGSKVQLVEDAKIRLYDPTNKRGFEHLAGEIEVTVTKGKGEFVVVTAFGVVKALGTVFEIDIVTTDSIDILAVEVKEGSVEVSNPQGSKVIKANQGVTVEKDKAPYDFRQDENLPPRLVERIQLMLDAFEAGDKKAWAVNFNIQAFFDLVKGNIEDWQNHPWFSKFSEDRIAQFKQMGADITSQAQLLEIYISSINIDEPSKHYIRSVELDDNGKLAMADCIKVEGHKRYVITTPQWTYFDGDWWQTDD
jgi:hypothetical protein